MDDKKHELFNERTSAIKSKMRELGNLTSGECHLSDKHIKLLAQMFSERDSDSSYDVEMPHVMRGFEWGMSAMRQIINGTDLD